VPSGSASRGEIPSLTIARNLEIESRTGMNAERDPDDSLPAKSFGAEPVSGDAENAPASFNEQLIRRLSEELAVHLRDGCVCYVRRSGNEYDVAQYPALRQDYPALYGFLLALNQQIDSATGCTWAFVMLLVALAGVVGIYEWFPDMGNHGYWTYPLVVLTSFFVWMMGNERAERGVFLRYADELNRQLAQHGIGRYRLIEWLIDDPQLQALLGRLKQETRLDELSRE